MPVQRKYLLIIDDVSENTQLKDYFSKFNYHILQYPSLTSLSTEPENAEALLVHQSLIPADLSIITNLYQRYPTPLIIISDHKDEDASVRMLEAGADDFMIKPLLPRELHARISAINRRVQRARKEASHEKDVLTFSNLRIYLASRQVYDDQQQELQLSAGEYDFLLAFIKKPQQVLDREFLLQATKSSELNPYDRRIDVQISRLRQKIEPDAKRPVLIKTIRNGGYLFTSPVLSLKKK